MIAYLKVIPAVTILLFSTFAFATPQQVADWNWAPPEPRKSKTIFAPKPFAGDNIFKGQAEVWLADVAEKLDEGMFRAIRDKAISEYVTKVGNHVAAHSVAPAKQYQFIVTTDNQANAMTAGGGRIYINVGMLEEVESEDELAAVLAHEIAHDAFSHAAKAVTRQMFWMTGTRKVKTADEVEVAVETLFKEYEKKPLAAIGEVVLGFSRFDELEADRAAFYNTYKAGYNPHALAALFKRIAREEKESMPTDLYVTAEILTLLFGSHPPTTQRTTALAWESNFVNMPPKDSHHQTLAFTTMKSHLTTLSNRL